MHRIIVLCFFITGSCVKSTAQSINYPDSTKRFFSDVWSRDVSDAYILDNSIAVNSYVDSFILLRDEFKINKPVKRSVLKHPTSKSDWTDTVLLTSKEMSAAFFRLQHPLIAKWDNSMFPSSHLVDQEQIDSVYQPINRLRRGLSPDNERYLQQKKLYDSLIERKLWRAGYYKFSNPIFLRDGKLAILYSRHYMSNFYVGYKLALYTFSNGKWTFYGHIWSGNIN